MKASRRSAMLKNREPRWIYFYLWTADGKPVYVGHASCPDERMKRHKGGRTVFGREFLRTVSPETWLEFKVLEGLRVWDVPKGPWASGIEAALIEHYGTRFGAGQGQNRLERARTDSEMAALAEARRRKRGACLT